MSEPIETKNTSVIDLFFNQMIEEIPRNILNKVDLKILKSLEKELSRDIDPETDIDLVCKYFADVLDFLSILNVWADKLDRDVNILYGKLEVDIRGDGSQKITVKEVESRILINEEYSGLSRLYNVVRILRDHVLNLRQLALLRKDLVIEKSTNIRAENKDRKNNLGDC